MRSWLARKDVEVEDSAHQSWLWYDVVRSRAHCRSHFERRIPPEYMIPHIFVRHFFLFLFCSLCLSGISSGGDERDQFKPNSSNWLWYDRFFFKFHTPQPLWRLHLGHVVLYLHAAVENSHIHYSSAEAVYKVSSINCLLLGVRTCGDMQPHIRCYYIATKGVDYIAIGRLTVWGHLSNRHTAE